MFKLGKGIAIMVLAILAIVIFSLMFQVVKIIPFINLACYLSIDLFIISFLFISNIIRQTTRGLGEISEIREIRKDLIETGYILAILFIMLGWNSVLFAFTMFLSI